MTHCDATTITACSCYIVLSDINHCYLNSRDYTNENKEAANESS